MFKSKLHAPAVNKNVVSRETVLAKLRHIPEYSLTSVVAPAGYGKTTAVLDLLNTCGIRAAWLSLDETDNDPVAFWRSFVCALEAISGEISSETDYVFATPELMSANIHVSIILDHLSIESSDFLLVLDDLHLITEASVYNGLSCLIDYLPEKAHLVVISRTEPDLKLSKLRLKEKAFCVEQRDLRFSAPDIGRFYEARGRALGDAEINQIESYTEGWAAAMVAVAMSLENSAGPDAISFLTRSSRDVWHYIKDEIISAWPPEKLTFAVKTSILDTLSEDLCAAVTGHQNCRLLLKEIYETSGFLMDLDGQKQSYRYHNLFKGMLSELLLDTAPGEIRRLHERAGQWFEERDMIPEAIDHFLSGGFFREALELIEHQIDYLIDKSEFGRVMPWLSRLPEGNRAGSFKIAAIYAIYYSEAGQYELARQWIAKMNVLKDDSRYAAVPDWQGYSRTVCILAEANILVREGNIDFLSLISAAAEISRGKYYKMPAYCDFNLADIYFHRCPISKLTGLFRKAPEAYAAMTEKYRGMISINPGYAPLGIGAHLYESNKLEKALPYLLSAVEEAREANCPGALVPAIVDIAKLKRAFGDMAGAFTVLDECERLLQGSGRAHWIYSLRAFRCRLYIDVGSADKVQAWFSASKLNIFTELNRIREFELITYARVLVSLNRIQDAEIILQRLLSFTAENTRSHSRVEVLNLLAMLAYGSHQMRPAYDYLEESLDIGIREGYVRSYLDELSPMARLLRAYIKSRGKRREGESAEKRLSYAADLLKQMPGSLLQTLKAQDVVASEVTERLLSQLTEREKKVLELLVNAATNKEIGEKLGISLRTVKTHTGNIYGKLGLKNRAQCVKLVRETQAR